MRARNLAVILALVAATSLAAERNQSIVRSFPSQPGKTVYIDAGALDLTVRSAEIDQIRLDIELAAAALKESAATAWLDKHHPSIEDSDAQLRVVVPDPGGVNLFKGVIVTKARINLVVPMSVLPDLSTSSGNLSIEGTYAQAKPMRLRAANGDVELDGWAPQVEARTTSGDITIRASQAIDDLLIRTASGTVELTGGAHKIRCDTSGGAVRLQGLLGSTGVATTSGNITARFDALPAADEVHVSSDSGKVRLSLPPGTQPGGELRSTKGEIRSSYAGQAGQDREPKLTLGGDGPKIFVTTISGRIELF